MEFSRLLLLVLLSSALLYFGCTQPAPVCGDGRLDASEVCESDAGCAGIDEICRSCKCVKKDAQPPAPAAAPSAENKTEQPPAPSCGNGKLEGGEQCEGGIACQDANRQCNISSCLCKAKPADAAGQGMQNNTTAPPAPKAAQPYCGDGTLDSGEVCDVGSKDKPSANGCRGGEYCSGCKCYTAAMPISCKANHQYASSTGLNNFIWTTLPSCGDDCSDLFGMDYKCDLRTCTCIPKDVTSHTCGNNFKEAMEECDGNQDWYCDSNEVCSSECECVVGTKGVCGNGIREITEQCDGASAELCGGAVCQPNCRCPVNQSTKGLVLIIDSVTTATCGNNVREGSEQCDGADRGYCNATQTCSNCYCWATAAQAVCGNNVREGSEQCDGADRNACSGSQTCNQQCSCQNTVAPAACGNGVKEGGEECDGNAGSCPQNYSCSQSCLCACQDTDADGKCDFADNCPSSYNPSQSDHDGDGIGDVCDPVPVNCAIECQGIGLTAYAQGENARAACEQKIAADVNAALAAIQARQCFTTCRYSSTNSTYLSLSFNSFSYGCCCLGPISTWKTEHPCTDCPGQNPVCPPASQVC